MSPSPPSPRSGKNLVWCPRNSPEELGRSINNAFELRQRGDYREYVELSYEQVSPFIGKARDFIARVTHYLETTSLIKKG